MYLGVSPCVTLRCGLPLGVTDLTMYIFVCMSPPKAAVHSLPDVNVQPVSELG